MNGQDLIQFYRPTDAYGEFSNFAEFPIDLDGEPWPTSEHYYQAQKFLDAKHQDDVRCAETPMDAAILGRDRERPMRKDWESVKVDVMRRAIHAKFTQHPVLTILLLETGMARLVEHTRRDSYWGDGGRGRNMLGMLLM